MATPPTREGCAAALFALVDRSVNTVVPFVTTMRVFRGYQDVTPDQMPALFVRQPLENEERTAGKYTALPPKRTMHFEFFVYTAEPQEPSVVPLSQLNQMADAIEAALAPDPTSGVSPLAGQAVSARIDGNIEFYENVQDGKNVLIVPITALRP